jgi:hypothetical protein
MSSGLTGNQTKRAISLHGLPWSCGISGGVIVFTIDVRKNEGLNDFAVCETIFLDAFQRKCIITLE